MQTETKSAVRELILGAVEAGWHTARQITDATGLPMGTAIHEIEILENLELFRVDPPDAPFTSWWRRRPKGRIVRDGSGMLHEVEAPRSATVPVRSTPPAKSEPVVIHVEDHLADIAIDKLVHHPLNPRGAVITGDQAFASLVDSIKAAGILEPLIVVPFDGDMFRIIAGHRRFEAAKAAAFATVPAVVRTFESAGAEEAAMLIENIQRKDLLPTQEGRAFYRRYLALGKDIHAVARETGCSQGFIAGRMRLLRLDENVQALVDARKISIANALALLPLGHDEQKKLLPRARGMKIDSLKQIVNSLKTGVVLPPERKPSKRVTTDNESFTRSWALGQLKDLGEAFIPAKHFTDSFDDVCQDACVEDGNEGMCAACPIPRFIAAVVRHKQRGETA